MCGSKYTSSKSMGYFVEKKNTRRQLSLVYPLIVEASMLKVSRILRAASDPVYDFESGEFTYVFEVPEYSFHGGYYEPVNRSGHPDNWSDAEGENPEVSAFVDCKVYRTDAADQETPLQVIEITVENDLIKSPATLPPEVSGFLDQVLNYLIETYWDPSDNDYDGGDDGDYDREYNDPW